jgi:hypothetical protein
LVFKPFPIVTDFRSHAQGLRPKSRNPRPKIEPGIQGFQAIPLFAAGSGFAATGGFRAAARVMVIRKRLGGSQGTGQRHESRQNKHEFFHD